MINLILKRYLLWVLLVSIFSCTTRLQQRKAPPLDFPVRIDTSSKPVVRQQKKKYYFDTWGITVDNLFDGARLTDAVAENDSVIRIIIEPENIPINPSPWYAFRVQSKRDTKIYFRLSYGAYKHRYNPKTSYDFNSWLAYDSLLVQFNNDSTEVVFPIQVSNQPHWISSQEIVTTKMVGEWCGVLGLQADVDFSIIGKSKLKRPLFMVDINHEREIEKPIIVILSRQHPPEVTGYFAMQHFIERVLTQDSLAVEFRNKYRVLVFPLLNPDGVDEGNWRHNMGGVDLNRDWAFYRQPETRQIANRIVAESNKSGSQVIIGLDFHSTWYDVYYTNIDTDNLTLPNFKNDWLAYIESHLDGYHLNERPSKVGQPVSKGWFYKKFNAVGVTYEIGDSTPREFIQQKGIVSAEGMMNILLESN